MPVFNLKEFFGVAPLSTWMLAAQGPGIGCEKSQWYGRMTGERKQDGVLFRPSLLIFCTFSALELLLFTSPTEMHHVGGGLARHRMGMMGIWTGVCWRAGTAG